MSWITRNLRQTMVWWDRSGKNKFNKPTFAAPVEKICRWEDKEELFIDTDGMEVKSQGVIYTAHDMASGDYVYLGELADLSSSDEADPTVVSTAYEVRAFRKVPGIKSNESERKAWI